MPKVLTVASQGQLTLPRALLRETGEPSYFRAVPVKGELRLRPAHRLTAEEVEQRYGRIGMTRDVLREALRILEAQKGPGQAATETAAEPPDHAAS